MKKNNDDFGNEPEVIIIPTAIDAESVLDMIGKNYRGDHVKGLAEWLKNSSDAYVRDDNTHEKHTPALEQVILIRIRNRTKTEPIRYECIDFSGTTHDAIMENFRVWFDRLAATRGSKGAKVLGGHGNGGKFYMRQMFETSSFTTYRDGRLSIFGFREDKKYGFLNGYKDIKVSPDDAFRLADIGDLLPKLPTIIQDRFKRGDIRFTVVRGAKPHAVGVKKYNKILDGLRVHPQARNIIQTKLVFGVSDTGELNRLEPEIIKPKPGFEGPFVYEIPERIENSSLANDNFAKGKLTLYTSEEPFDRRDDRAALNCISFKGKDVGIIAAYNISELGGTLRNHTVTEFIYGECECPILEDPAHNMVDNDRERLIKSEITDDLLRWICVKVNEVTDKIVELTEHEQQQNDLKKSSEFNKILNKWMNKYMLEVYGQIFTGTNQGDSGGLVKSDGESTVHGTDKNVEQGGFRTKGSGSGDKKTKGSTFPRILQSNDDDDPLNPGNKLPLNSTHPLVYQRPEDKKENIYWINTVAPIAQRIRILGKYAEDAQGNQDNPRWNEYMFQRHIEIILKQIIHEFFKDNIEIADEISCKIDKVSKEVHEAASKELHEHIFK